MGVTLKKQRDGSWREHWYGDYVIDGHRTVVNLNVRWRGTPPTTGSLREPGDGPFEVSRAEAERALTRYFEEARHKGRAEHLTERLIESKTGRSVEYARITDLPLRWRRLGREQPASERYLAACDAVFQRFAAFLEQRRPDLQFLYEVTPDEAAAFITAAQQVFARKTVRDTIKLMHKAFARWLPVGSANPFAAFIGRRSHANNETVHRKPFTPEELKALLNAARSDAFLYPLITAAACTGLRRGDVCRLPWSAIDWKNNMLAVKTSKTGVEVEIPIFRPLLEVLKARKDNGSEYVFPEAAQMLADSPDGLTWRFKKLVANALSDGQPAALAPVAEPAQLAADGAVAITAQVPAGPRRDRMLEVFRRYCGGQSVRQLEALLGIPRATVSNDLHAVENYLGRPVLRVQTKNGVKSAIARLTQMSRVHGQRAASVRDWHALRATFVTLALANGVPVELVRRVTGHATVETVLRHYFRPDREQFRSALAVALPEVLTGVRTARLKPADELAALAAKVAEGKATDLDKARLRHLVKKL